MLIVMWRLDHLKEWKVQDIFGVFFSFRDLRALFALSRMKGCVGYDRDVKHVGWLAQIGSPLSEEALLSFLKSGSMVVRGRALRALRQIDFGDEAEEALLTELGIGEYTTAYIAAAILGEHKVARAIPALRQALVSDDVYLQGECMIALARLEGTDALPDILRIYESSDNPRVVIHGAGALALIGDHAYIYAILDKASNDSFPSPVRDSLLTSLAELCGYGDTLYRFIRAYNQRPESGWVFFMDAIEGDTSIPWLAQLRSCWASQHEPETMDEVLHAIQHDARHLTLPDLTPFRNILNHSPKFLLCLSLLAIWSSREKSARP